MKMLKQIFLSNAKIWKIFLSFSFLLFCKQTRKTNSFFYYTMIEYAKMIFFLERLGRNDNFEKWLIFYGILFGLSSYLTYTKKQNQSHTHT
jgi:hypothetical protein